MPGMISDSWVAERDYRAQDGQTALGELAASRAQLLEHLPPPDSPIWVRRGQHTVFGPASFLELVCLALEHDILHIAQVRKTLGRDAD